MTPSRSGILRFLLYFISVTRANLQMIVEPPKDIEERKRTTDDDIMKKQLADFEISPKATPLSASRSRQYHEPPRGVDYSTNDSVFGKILRGELSARVLAETTNLLAFQDKYPRAPLHALVIPKKHVESVLSLSPTDLPLLIEMENMGLELLKARHPDAYSRNDFVLCFHLPPFNSVNHLHLHVLAPASSMNLLYRYLKYLTGTWWSTSLATVKHRLQLNPKARD